MKGFFFPGFSFAKKIEKLSSFFQSTKRVIVIAAKPEWKDYIAMIKVIGIGIIIVGIIGFVIKLIFSLTGIGF